MEQVGVSQVNALFLTHPVYSIPSNATTRYSAHVAVVYVTTRTYPQDYMRGRIIVDMEFSVDVIPHSSRTQTLHSYQTHVSPFTSPCSPCAGTDSSDHECSG